jgi:uncharacterized protein
MVVSASAGAAEQTQPQTRSAPVVSPLAEPFWAAVRERRLVVQRCDRCGRCNHFPVDVCPQCGDSNALSWREVSGNGVVYTFSVVHRSSAPGFTHSPPYVIAWIDLAEGGGLRMFGNVLGCPVEDVYIGMPVQVLFEHLDGFGLIPNFRSAVAGNDEDGESST